MASSCNSAVSAAILALPTVVLRCAGPSAACSMAWVSLQKLRESRQFLLSRHDGRGGSPGCSAQRVLWGTTGAATSTSAAASTASSPSSSCFVVPCPTRTTPTSTCFGGFSTSFGGAACRGGTSVSVEVCGEMATSMVDVTRLLDLAEEAAKRWEPAIKHLGHIKNDVDDLPTATGR